MTRTTWPEAADEAGWAKAITGDGPRDCPPGLIVAALRALVETGDRPLVRALTMHVSDRVTRRLRRLISIDHENLGEDIVAEAHGVVMHAIFDARSVDGPEMVANFWPRVRNRGIDAARSELGHARRLPPREGDEGRQTVPPRVPHRACASATPATRSCADASSRRPPPRSRSDPEVAAAAARRDDVLVAFHAACPRPAAEDLAVWIDRHPCLADDLRYHAEAMLSALGERYLRPEPSHALLARARSTASDALDAAWARAASSADGLDLEALMAEAATDVPRLARALGLGRALLVDLVQGRVVLPAPVALLGALADELRTTMSVVEAATRAPTAHDGPGRFDVAPSAPRRMFADILSADPATPPEAKVRWLVLLEEG